MWLIILHVLINVLGLLLLLAGSFQILISPKYNNDSQERKNRLIEVGWYLYTVGVILGAIQAKEMSGYYWVWDLKETLSLLTVLGYFFFVLSLMITSPLRSICLSSLSLDNMLQFVFLEEA